LVKQVAGDGVAVGGRGGGPSAGRDAAGKGGGTGTGARAREQAVGRRAQSAVARTDMGRGRAERGRMIPMRTWSGLLLPPPPHPPPPPEAEARGHPVGLPGRGARW